MCGRDDDPTTYSEATDMAPSLTDIIGDVIDSRDVIDRIEELERALEGGDFGVFESDDELARLRAFAVEGRGAADWEYGEQFIADHAFEDHARQLAEDIGAIPSDYSWPASHIDWEAAARALQMDYSSMEWEGTTYWYR